MAMPASSPDHFAAFILNFFFAGGWTGDASCISSVFGNSCPQREQYLALVKLFALQFGQEMF